MSDEFPQEFGRYQLTDLLALGGMAELFLAHSKGAHGFEKKLVIKRILPHLARDPHFTQMFIAEAKLTARLSHPKIAQTYELGQIESQLYIAMEYVDGLDLLAILRECAHRHARLPMDVSVHILNEVLDALDFAHKSSDDNDQLLGIVHRDVSPSNILVSRRGNVKLVDFGIAHAFEQEHRTRSGTLKGKYGYMAPEQVLGEGVSFKSDIFSAGIVLSEMLMGRRLFAAPNELDVLLMVRDVNLKRLDKLGEDIDGRLQAILRVALSKNPDERYEDAAAFREALDEWMFDKRYRVTPSQISEVVDTLYEDARERRRKQLDEMPVGGQSEAAALAAVGGAPAGLAGQPTELEGIPTGLLDVGDSVRIEIARPEEGDIPAGAEPQDQEVDFDLDELISDDELGLEEDPGAVAAPAPRASVVRPAREQGVPSHGIDDFELSVRYPSISAAVASISPPGPDPAAKDFDDSDISSSSGAGTAIHPKISARPPTVDDVAGGPRPAGPLLDPIADTPADAGDLSITPPVAVLFRLAATSASGLLVVSLGGIRKEIYLKIGVPEFVSSNVAGELFGAYLVRQEAISAAELDMALAMMPHYGGKLGDTLVGLGLMKPLDVFRHLTRQVRQKLIDVCTWDKGKYAWHAGKKNPREAFPLDLDPYEVIGASAMKLPDELIRRWTRRFENARLKSAKVPSIGPESFRVAGALLGDVYHTLDGKKTLSELRNRYTDDEERLRFLRAAYLLFNTGLAKDTCLTKDAGK